MTVPFLMLKLFLVAALCYLLMTSLRDIVQRRIEARFGRADSTIRAPEPY